MASSAIDQRTAAAPTPPWFDYDTAFSRNIGWFTDREQQILREKRVAIAGMGGVGGIHMLTFARLGVGRFHVADLDRFELANFNRQMGASARTLHQPKAASVVELAREINPEIEATIFEHGVDEANLAAFLDGVDVYVDGLDFFVLDIRRKLFAMAYERGIPALTAGPLGMGTGYIVFKPGGMSFEEYFRLEGKDEDTQYASFLLGLAPEVKHRSYLADQFRVDMANKRVPSTAIGCQLAAGVAAAEAVKLMLGRGPVRAAPHYHYFDAYLGISKVGKLRWGNAGPIQSIKVRLLGKLVDHFSRGARPKEPDVESDTPVLTRILDAARWAPSPDNSQPWRFEPQGEHRLLIHLDREAGNPYQYRQSEPNLLAAGMLVEALALAASQYGWGLDWKWVPNDGQSPTIEVRFDPAAGVSPDPLARYLKTRSVDRGLYRRRPLSADDRQALHTTLAGDFDLDWVEDPAKRMALGQVNAAATSVRLRSRACYEVHRKVIDWKNRYSRTGLPAAAVGVDPLAQRIMGWAMRNWARMRTCVTLGAGHYAAAEMDLLPATFSSAFLIVRPRQPLQGPADRVRAGRRLMRFWLEADRRGLALQPALAPIWLAAQTDPATASSLERSFVGDAARVAERYRAVTGYDAGTILFQARIGYSPRRGAGSRSIRRPLDALVHAP